MRQLPQAMEPARVTFAEIQLSSQRELLRRIWELSVWIIAEPATAGRINPIPHSEFDVRYSLVIPIYNEAFADLAQRLISCSMRSIVRLKLYSSMTAALIVARASWRRRQVTRATV
jgi:hypothetical protein